MPVIRFHFQIYKIYGTKQLGEQSSLAWPFFLKTPTCFPLIKSQDLVHSIYTNATVIAISLKWQSISWFPVILHWSSRYQTVNCRVGGFNLENISITVVVFPTMVENSNYKWSPGETIASQGWIWSLHLLARLIYQEFRKFSSFSLSSMNNHQHLFKKKHNLKFAINVGHAHDVGDHLFVINGLTLYYAHHISTLKAPLSTISFLSRKREGR